MAHAYVQLNPRGDSAAEFDAGVTALSRFKGIRPDEHHVSSVASVAVAGTAAGAPARIWHASTGTLWLIALGQWLPLPARPGTDGHWLIDEYRRSGAEGLARQLQGLFAIVIGDGDTGRVHAITDRCGSLHLFHTSSLDRRVLCTSSAAIASSTAALDPRALHEFIATGIVYADRTLFAGVRKLAPASVYTFVDGRVSSTRYWRATDIAAESFGLDEAVERLHAGLVGVLRALPQGERPIVSDLTGGYDSRLLLCGLLDAGIAFQTTVSGDEHLPDVLVAERLARLLKLQHARIAQDNLPSGALFDRALRMTDGEYDAFDYARILHTHRQLSERHTMSLNGSFGELARGYWWELLWPRLAVAAPLDAAMIARKRFAALPYDASIFAGDAKFALAAHMAQVAEHELVPARSLPNTSQLDWLYYTLRMQRWQGRIASATNQLWPSLSPIGFAQVLDPILAARASVRVRSRLVRELFERCAPRLARVPLEHGYPPRPATPLNFWQFAPLGPYYVDKVRRKLLQHLGRRTRSTTSQSQQMQVPRTHHARLFDDCGIDGWLQRPLLVDSGWFDEARLLAALDPRVPRTGAAIDQWQRLVTIEALLRALKAKGR